MRIDVLTLFPGMFEGPLSESILKRAREKQILDIRTHDLRRFSRGTHKQVDDSPYGGGAGMVLMCEPVVKLIEAVVEEGAKDLPGAMPRRIFLSPRGRTLSQPMAERMAKKHEWLLLLCGHYEGIDQRIIDGWIDEELSIGDYVLTGGELPAMVLIDVLARQVPGVLGKEESAAAESFSKALGRRKEYPHYTRPEDFRGRKVPSVLLSGNHKAIEEWRRSQLQ